MIKQKIFYKIYRTKNNFSKLFIKVDGPKDEYDSIKVNEVIDIINIYKKNFDNTIFQLKKKFRFAITIIRSIDYVLEKEETVIVLEDDQLVSKQFFVLETFRFRNNEKIFQINLAATSQMNIKNIKFLS